jgi:7,8-dihydropterin-6-yl-methyl-4-(beta-D-ribofuranosyl)aminobenzene 5'-phosphate synthase
MTILCEDQAQNGFLDKKFNGQHGLSLFIEADCSILFDAGPSDVVLGNAALSGVNLKSAEWIVLSHGHWDHADGLLSLTEACARTKLLVHPGVFANRYRPSGLFNGMSMSRDQAAEDFELHESTAPFKLSEKVWFLGEIPRRNDFESRTTNFFHVEGGKKQPDYFLDDTALAIGTPQGVAVVTGCSHAGVCNICEHALQVIGDDRLYMVLGGFHLLDDSEIVDKTVAYFRERKVERLYPMHCTGLPALGKFYAAFGIDKLCAGDALEIPL